MSLPAVSRRSFVRNTSIVAAGLPLFGSLNPGPGVLEVDKAEFDSVPLRWLDEMPPEHMHGTTWGVPWPKNFMKGTEALQLQDAAGQPVPVQSWVTARWPDGSVKWSAHSMAPGNAISTHYSLKAGKPALPSQPIAITTNNDYWVIDTGVIRCTIARHGDVLIPRLDRGQQEIAVNGRLVLLCQNQPSATPGSAMQTTVYTSRIEKAVLEQQGPLRVVVKLSGQHFNEAGHGWLPFVVRFYLYAGSESLRCMHSIIFDGDENKDFISGLGIRFEVPMQAPLYERHIRFCSAEGGVFGEAVQGLTGLRRDPGMAVRQAQIQGHSTPPKDSWPANVRDGLNYIPAFGDYTLTQPNADGFIIRKRTGASYGWVQSTAGSRAAGTCFLGTPAGGLAMGLRHFWQSHPAQIDIRHAQTERGEMTMWFWSPESPAMDLRFYHDGMGQDTYAKQLAGLDITYEDYEPGFGTAMGIARTSELQLWVLDGTPSHEKMASLANSIEQPAQLLPTPAYMKQAGAFGDFWSLPDNQNEASNAIEKQLAFYFSYYQEQVARHKWYGFWNYGDVMHSYDTDRHTWRYDVGGFAWDNSELSTDLWLWFYFLRTGRADVFRFAESMTRHTGEVDVHHLGRFAPLGSRHNVQHWGCSAKQLRISTVANRRIYYFLTADERVGDLMNEQVNAYRTLQTIAPGRKLEPGNVQQAAENKDEVNLGFGTDWGSAAAAWFTHWERTGDKHSLALLQNSMKSIAAQPHGFLTGGAAMNINTGTFRLAPKGSISVSHLNAAFGLPEICAELIQTFDMPSFEKAWLQYCRLYNAPAAEQQAELGKDLGKLNLGQGHSRLTAYAAMRLKDPELSARAWQEFYGGAAGIRRPVLETKTITPPWVMNPVVEAPGISTNAVAQWGLAAMQCLACAGVPPAQETRK